jgi:hypothetical protein
MRIGKPSYHLTKRVFGLKNQAHDFEDATWTWVCKRGLPTAEKEPYAPLALDRITVDVWPEHYKPTDPNLTLHFTPDKEGLAQARKYASEIITSGAIIAEINVKVNIRDKHGVSVQTENYWSDEITPVNPMDL